MRTAPKTPRERFDAALGALREALDELPVHDDRPLLSGTLHRDLGALADAFDALERTAEDLGTVADDLRQDASRWEARADELEEELDGVRDELEEARGALFELRDEALDVATTDPHDPAWDLVFNLERRAGS